ncbi:MAG: ComF family protein [Hyphomicrobiaceae bacterium]|nr:ComF family protein [Hyphomicrobiaceae bacterium]
MDHGSGLITERLNRAGRLAGRVADLLLPPTCPACGVPTGGPDGVCAACFRRLSFIEAPFCARLGRPLRYDLGAGALSAEAIADPPPFTRQRAAVLYNETAGRIVHGFKYRDRPELGAFMARAMARSGKALLDEADLVVPVPMHRLRLFLRRYNQSALLAKTLAHGSERTYAPLVLKRTRRTRRQVGLDQKARAANVKRAFSVSMKDRPVLAGRRVLLVDDVVTSGATVREATKALLRAGALAVDVLAFALVVPGEEGALYA